MYIQYIYTRYYIYNIYISSILVVKSRGALRKKIHNHLRLEELVSGVYLVVGTTFITPRKRTPWWCGKLDIFRGGRRYFARGEITALVGDPGDLAVYRYVLVIPATIKCYL